MPASKISKKQGRKKSGRKKSGHNNSSTEYKEISDSIISNINNNNFNEHNLLDKLIKLVLLYYSIHETVKLVRNVGNKFKDTYFTLFSNYSHGERLCARIVVGFIVDYLKDNIKKNIISPMYDITQVFARLICEDKLESSIENILKYLAKYPMTYLNYVASREIDSFENNYIVLPYKKYYVILEKPLYTYELYSEHYAKFRKIYGKIYFLHMNLGPHWVESYKAYASKLIKEIESFVPGRYDDLCESSKLRIFYTFLKHKILEKIYNEDLVSLVIGYIIPFKDNNSVTVDPEIHTIINYIMGTKIHKMYSSCHDRVRSEYNMLYWSDEYDRILEMHMDM